MRGLFYKWQCLCDANVNDSHYILERLIISTGRDCVGRILALDITINNKYNNNDYHLN